MRQIAGLQQQEEKLDAVELRHGPEQGQDAQVWEWSRAKKVATRMILISARRALAGRGNEANNAFHRQSQGCRKWLAEFFLNPVRASKRGVKDGFSLVGRCTTRVSIQKRQQEKSK